MRWLLVILAAGFVGAGFARNRDIQTSASTPADLRRFAAIDVALWGHEPPKLNVADIGTSKTKGM